MAFRHGAPAERQWLRKVMCPDTWKTFLELGPESLDVVEVSGAGWEAPPWRSHEILSFPEFDLCSPPAGDLPSSTW